VIAYTIGHSTRGIDEFIALLERSRIERLIDVRAFPGSRRHPHFNREALARTLPERGIEYYHLPALGGRRRPRADAPPSGWRNESFRGYAEYMRTPEFHQALHELMALASERRTAIMCSEAVPWRCHRTLIADALTARGCEVEHILDAKTSPHVLTSFAVVHNGEVSYPPTSDANASYEQHALALDES
jgi:uncharacterized protein (DUF488 family)